MKKIFLLLFLLINIICFGDNPNVTFITTASKDSTNLFWVKVLEYMKIAADQLEINLKIVSPDFEHRTEQERLMKEELNAVNKPDYILYKYYGQSGYKMLELAENEKVYSFLFNADITENDMGIVGKPGEKFKYWIGHIYPDDFNAGYEEAKILINKARTQNLKGKDNKIHIIGLSGRYDSDVAIDRNNGLKKAVSENSDIVLHQIVFTFWESEKAAQATEKLLIRYPETSVIWCGSDSIGIGAAKTAETLGRVPGKDILLGGIDWSEKGIEAVKNGTLINTIGGHFLESIIALVLIKDHYEGIDLSTLDFPIKTKMNILNNNNVEALENILKYDNFKKIDLKKFSKYYNKNLKEYNFDILEQIIAE